jgi:hypothetical protein
MNRTLVGFMLLSGSFAFAQTGQPEGSKAASAPQMSASQVTAQHGQTEAQKQKDLQECYNIAKAKTGVDPQALMGVAGGSAATSSSQTAGTSGATSGVESAVGEAASQAGQSAATSVGQGADAAKSSAATNAKTKLDLFSVANQGCVVTCSGEALDAGAVSWVDCSANAKLLKTTRAHEKKKSTAVFFLNLDLLFVGSQIAGTNPEPCGSRVKSIRQRQ